MRGPGDTGAVMCWECSCERFEQAFYEEVGARHTNQEQLFASLSACSNMKSVVWDEWTRRKEPASQRYARKVLLELRTNAPFMVLPRALTTFQAGGCWECLQDATKPAMKGMTWEEIDQGNAQWLVPLCKKGLNDDGYAEYKEAVLEFLLACDCGWAFLSKQVDVILDPQSKQRKRKMPQLVTGAAVPGVSEDWQQAVRLVCLLRWVAERAQLSQGQLGMVPPAASLDLKQGQAPAGGVESTVEAAYREWRPDSTEMSNADLRAFAVHKGVKKVQRNSGRKWLCGQIGMKILQESKETG